MSVFPLYRSGTGLGVHSLCHIKEQKSLREEVEPGAPRDKICLLGKDLQNQAGGGLLGLCSLPSVHA